jgi:hypothetical protein
LKSIMLGFGWLTLRQAQEALRSGRLEEAQRLLEQPGVAGQRGAGAALAQLARLYVERGERLLRQDDAEGAWRELLCAEQLQTAERSGERLRQALVRLGLAQVRALLAAGELVRAEEASGRLRGRDVHLPELQALDEATRAWLFAREVGDRGEFGPALDALDRAGRLLGGPSPALAASRDELERRREPFAPLLGRLHEAADAGRWREAVELAEQVLAVAPQHREARKVRSRAWKAVEPVTVAVRPEGAEAESPRGPEEQTPRFLLWIDGVGGFLVCLGGRLTLGHATPDARVDIPLVADVSRLHATLTRDAEGYVLEAVRPTQVNGQPAGRVLLRSGDRITLGASCQMQFRQPVPLSASARLDLTSGHRLPLSVEGVLLMADTLILGPAAQAHVTVPALKQPIVLFRHKDGLGLRHSGGLTVNGQAAPERGPLSPRANVVGDDIVFALEPVGTRIGG